MDLGWTAHHSLPAASSPHCCTCAEHLPSPHPTPPSTGTHTQNTTHSHTQRRTVGFGHLGSEHAAYHTGGWEWNRVWFKHDWLFGAMQDFCLRGASLAAVPAPVPRLPVSLGSLLTYRMGTTLFSAALSRSPAAHAAFSPLLPPACISALTCACQRAASLHFPAPHAFTQLPAPCRPTGSPPRAGLPLPPTPLFAPPCTATHTASCLLTLTTYRLSLCLAPPHLFTAIPPLASLSLLPSAPTPACLPLPHLPSTFMLAPARATGLDGQAAGRLFTRLRDRFSARNFLHPSHTCTQILLPLVPLFHALPSARRHPPGWCYRHHTTCITCPQAMP